MVATRKKASARARKAAPSASPAPRVEQVWTLRLFVAGQTAKSIRALANLKMLCEERLKGRYQIEVVDLLENPHMARGAQIVAVPTLEIKLPQSVQRIIGDLSSTDRVLVGLALQKIG